ncbi:1499_t:CDS:10, partial [Scutellospora calospora]
KKAVCQQDNDDDEGFLDEDDEAEYDALLINNTSDLVAAMALVLGYDFVPYFKEYINYIAKYYKKTKPISERSMAIGCLGETTIGLKDGISEFTEQLLPLYLKALADEDEEVRSNAAFAIGLLCQYTRLDISSRYGDILSALHPLFTGQSAMNVTDNACGAVCRMIMACPQAVPMDQVLEAVLRTLPLKHDFEENEPVFKCICTLFRANNSFVFNHVPELLNIFAKVISPPEEQLTDQTRQEIMEIIQALNQKFPEAVLTCTNAFLASIADILAQNITLTKKKYENPILTPKSELSTSTKSLHKIEEKIEKKLPSSIPTNESFNYIRTLRFSSYGFLIAPVVHTWFSFLDRRFPLPQITISPQINISPQISVSKNLLATQMNVVIKRLTADQIVFAPFGLFLFFNIIGLLEGHDINEIKEKFHEAYIPALKANYAVWPIVQLINFRFLPLRYRLPFVSSIGNQSNDVTYPDNTPKISNSDIQLLEIIRPLKQTLEPIDDLCMEYFMNEGIWVLQPRTRDVRERGIGSLV